MNKRINTQQPYSGIHIVQVCAKFQLCRPYSSREKCNRSFSCEQVTECWKDKAKLSEDLTIAPL